MRVFRPQSHPAGSSPVPILVFLGILMLSALFFVLFSLPKLKNQAAPSQPTSATPPTAPKPQLPVPTPSTAPALPQTPEKLVFSRPEAVLKNLTESLLHNKIVPEQLGFDATVPPTRVAALQAIFSNGDFRPSDEPASRIGRMGDTERWRLPITETPALAATVASATTTSPNLAAPAPIEPSIALPQISSGTAKVLFLEADVRLSRQEGARVKNIRFSPELVASAAQKGRLTSAEGLKDEPDALVISGGFLEDLLSRKFQSARSLTDEKLLTHEKLAGLCIVFEEGGYQLVPGQGLNVTSVNDKTAWTIVRVKGAAEQQVNEFGIEMAKDTGGNWKVNALNFDKMLQGYAQATGAGKVYYTPVISSPGGGESLVVYFEYDKSELTPRALRQMEIVSGLLKSDPARKLRISGHTDSSGTEDYNQKLSKARAEVVTTTLRGLGVSAEQIVETGMGEALPLDPNQRQDGTDNPEGRSRNRRTEIYLDF